MLTTTSQRLIQFQRIAVLSDLSSDSETMVRYGGALARWYGAELLLVHAEPLEFYAAVSTEGIPPIWSPAGCSGSEAVQEELDSVIQRLHLRDLSPRIIARAGDIGMLLKGLQDYRPSLLVLASHGREGIRKWLAGSVAEEVFRQVQWPVMVLGPGIAARTEAPQTEFERILYATDLSAVSLKALQYAAGIAHDHEAQLTALYVDSNPSEGFTFDRVMELQRLEDWLRDQIDGLAETLVGVRCVVEFGKPESKIVEAARERQADIVVIGARRMGVASALASHFLGGTAYEVVCSSPCPVLIVPQSQ